MSFIVSRPTEGAGSHLTAPQGSCGIYPGRHHPAFPINIRSLSQYLRKIKEKGGASVDNKKPEEQQEKRTKKLDIKVDVRELRKPLMLKHFTTS